MIVLNKNVKTIVQNKELVLMVSATVIKDSKLMIVAKSHVF
jgi:hypothetical protein